MVKHNPFSTQFVRPGVIPFFETDDSIEQIAVRFAENNFVGQVVGPHGSGKSTLTLAISEHLKEKFNSVRVVTVRDFRNIKTQGLLRSTTNNGSQLWIVDGAERLSGLQRWLLRKNICKTGGLLVTSHKSVSGFPLIYETQTDVETLGQIVDFLAPNVKLGRVDIGRAFEKANGNVREALMLLYDAI